MAEFRVRFIARAVEDAQHIERALEAGDFATLRNVCHGIAGNAGMFGFTDVGTAARAVERTIDACAAEEDVRVSATDLQRRLMELRDEH